MQYAKLAAILSIGFLFASCTAQVSNTAQSNEPVELWAETIADENAEHGEIDVLVIKTAEGEFEMSLPGRTGETVYHNPIVGDSHTIAFFYNYWAGIGDLTRVRQDGDTLLVETMVIAEPHPEFGLMCEPWEEVGYVNISEDASFIVQDGAPAQDYREEFNCVCQQDEAGEYQCV